jgi:tetratricopeptide (TPR) repeat protein
MGVKGRSHPAYVYRPSQFPLVPGSVKLDFETLAGEKNMSEGNSVYIAYRRGIAGLVARAVFQDLRANGIDAFMDVEQMNSEQTETIYLNQIAARPYFLLILTPGTLEPFAERGDWLRTQVEQAAKTKRVIIPFASPNFKPGDIPRLVGGSLGAELARGKPVEFKYGAFPEAMSKIRIHVLKPVDLPLTPTSAADKGPVARALESAGAAPAVTRDHLLAQAHFEQALVRREDETDARIKDYTEAIRLSPDFAEAYARRGANRDVQGDLEGALADCDAAIRIRPD